MLRPPGLAATQVLAYRAAQPAPARWAPGVRETHVGGRLGRLSLGAVGVGLLVLVLAAWVTALPYLATRLGLPSVVRLSYLDGVHAAAGVVGAVFLAVKTVRIGFRTRVPGLPRVLLWQRWISWSLLGLYGAITLTGIAAILPIPGSLRAGAVNAHLMFSVWAVAPTAWHVWHYRQRFLPLISRLRRGPSRRLQFGLAISMLPLLVVALFPRTLSPLAEVGQDVAWQPAALQGMSIDQLYSSTDGRYLFASGDGVYVTMDGKRWKGIQLPTQSGMADLHVRAISSSASGQTYVATSDSIFASPRPGGPYRQVSSPAAVIRDLAGEPDRPLSLWAATSAGPRHSVDGGRNWITESVALPRSSDANAVSIVNGRPMVSNLSGVYMLAADGGPWKRSSDKSGVVSLQPTSDRTRVYASTAGGEIGQLTAKGWQWLPMAASQHQHVDRVPRLDLDATAEWRPVAVEAGGRLYFAGTPAGVLGSADRGGTWTPLKAGLPRTGVRHLAVFEGGLWAATDSGAFRVTEDGIPPATSAWWLRVLGVAIVCALLGVFVAALGGHRLWNPTGQRWMIALRARRAV